MEKYSINCSYSNNRKKPWTETINFIQYKYFFPHLNIYPDHYVLGQRTIPIICVLRLHLHDNCLDLLFSFDPRRWENGIYVHSFEQTDSVVLTFVFHFNPTSSSNSHCSNIIEINYVLIQFTIIVVESVNHWC